MMTDPAARLTPRTPTGKDAALCVGVLSVVMAAVAVATAFLLIWAGHPKAGIGLAIPVTGLAGCVVLWLMYPRRGWTLADLGLVRPRRSMTHLLWQVPLAMTVCALITAVLAPLLGISPESGRESTKLAFTLSPALTVLAVVGAVVLVPVVEEVMFRTMLLGWLRTRMQLVAATVTCGVAFGLVHVTPAAIVYVGCFGVVLATLRVWYDSLIPCIVAHAINNAVVAAAAMSALT